MDEFLRTRGSPHFLRKIERFFEPTPAERRALLAACSKPMTVSRYETLVRRDEPLTRLFVVLSGTFVQTVLSLDGGQQVLSFALPGDAIGANGLATGRHLSDARAVTDAVVSPVPIETIENPVSERMMRFYYALRLAEQSIANDRLTMLGRARAEERLLHLFLELNARQRMTVSDLGDRLWCPYSQTDLGDATGMTNVYVSKMLGRLRDANLIEVGQSSVEILNRRHVEDRVDFVDRYAAIDVRRLVDTESENSTEPA